MRCGPAAGLPETLPNQMYGLSLVLSADRRWLVLAGANGGPDSVLWDLQRTPAAAMLLRGHTERPTTCLITPDGRWAVTADDDKTARLWDLHKANPAEGPIVLADHADIIRALAVDPSGRRLVTASRDATARGWHLDAANPALGAAVVAKSGKEPGSGLTAVGISADGQRVVTGDYDGVVKVWDVDGSAATPAVVLRGHKKEVAGAVLTADGHFVITDSDDGTIRIWNLQADEPSAAPVVMRGRRGHFSYLALDQDERWIVTRDSQTIQIWEHRPHELLSLARASAGRNFKPLEWAQYFAERSYRKVFDDLPVPPDE